MRKEFAELRVDLARRFAAVDLRFAALEARVAALEERFAALEGPRFAALEARIDARLIAFEARLFRWFVHQALRGRRDRRHRRAATVTRPPVPLFQRTVLLLALNVVAIDV